MVREARHGRPRDAMKLEEVARPTPGPNEAVVRVMAAGINDNHIWACLGKPVPISRLHPDEPAHIGGTDCAGVVEAVGPGVTRWKPGDEVVTQPALNCGECAACNGFEQSGCLQVRAWGYETSDGSFADDCKVQGRQLLPKPKRLSWEQAASYGSKLFTAYRMLITRSGLKPGDRVLIWGAAGGMGSYAVRLCLVMNAVPICVVSSAAKADFCRSLGARLVLDRSGFPFANVRRLHPHDRLELRLDGPGGAPALHVERARPVDLRPPDPFADPREAEAAVAEALLESAACMPGDARWAAFVSGGIDPRRG